MISNFAKDDSPFVCAFCGKQVSPLGYENRKHCPYCLYSVHADLLSPKPCRGLQQPISITPALNGYTIEYKCTKCGKRSCHNTADDDDAKQIINLLQMFEDKK